LSKDESRSAGKNREDGGATLFIKLEKLATQGGENGNYKNQKGYQAPCKGEKNRIDRSKWLKRTKTSHTHPHQNQKENCRATGKTDQTFKKNRLGSGK